MVVLPLHSSTKNLLKTDRDADLPENPVHLAAGHDRLLGKLTLELSCFSQEVLLTYHICMYIFAYMCIFAYICIDVHIG